MTKQYDEAYFRRWYRGPHRVHTRAEVRRKVALAVTTAEYFLRRPIRNVLDVGCGEAAWLPHLRAMRRRVAYVGVDPSDYAVEEYGESRNVRKGELGGLRALNLRGRYDLIVCSDVMHYLSEEQIARGIGEIVELLDGVAYLEVLTREDDIIGDLEGLIQRPARWYRKLFAAAGLVQVGAYLWIGPTLSETASDLEMFLR